MCVSWNLWWCCSIASTLKVWLYLYQKSTFKLNFNLELRKSRNQNIQILLQGIKIWVQTLRSLRVSLWENYLVVCPISMAGWVAGACPSPLGLHHVICSCYSHRVCYLESNFLSLSGIPCQVSSVLCCWSSVLSLVRNKRWTGMLQGSHQPSLLLQFTFYIFILYFLYLSFQADCEMLYVIDLANKIK